LKNPPRPVRGAPITMIKTAASRTAGSQHFNNVWLQ
jgi:hypothetical protein